MIAKDITNEINAALRDEVLRRGARFYRLELGTLMMRNLETLDTGFFLDEDDATGQLLDCKPPKRRFR